MIASIVIPTYKECANLNELITRIFEAIAKEQGPSSSSSLTPSNVEVIVVDDNSQDGSEQIVNELGKKYNARIIVRTLERGLSSAVIRGFEEAKGQYLMCMDADLQHPPEAVPLMFREIIGGKVEFVLGTRYGSGEMRVDKNWPAYRRVISSGARLLARPLTPLSDPMSGFFAITKTAYERAKQNNLDSIGFKIALELYVKARIQKHSEVPFAFGVRVHGYSKLSSKVIVHYIQHLRKLYGFSYPYFIYFIIVAVLILFYLTFSILFSGRRN